MKIAKQNTYPQNYKTKKQLADAVKDYFDSISREVIVTEVVVDHYDDKGKPVYREEAVCNIAGEKIKVIKFAIPPTINGLCEHLSIDRATWNSYKQDEKFADIATRARERIEKYLEEELLTNPKVQGVIFNLSNNFGWTDKKEVDLGEGTRMQMAAAAVPLTDKLSKLKEIAKIYLGDTE